MAESGLAGRMGWGWGVCSSFPPSSLFYPLCLRFRFVQSSSREPIHRPSSRMKIILQSTFHNERVGIKQIKLTTAAFHLRALREVSWRRLHAELWRVSYVVAHSYRWRDRLSNDSSFWEPQTSKPGKDRKERQHSLWPGHCVVLVCKYRDLDKIFVTWLYNVDFKTTVCAKSEKKRNCRDGILFSVAVLAFCFSVHNRMSKQYNSAFYMTHE